MSDAIMWERILIASRELAHAGELICNVGRPYCILANIHAVAETAIQLDLTDGGNAWTEMPANTRSMRAGGMA